MSYLNFLLGKYFSKKEKEILVAKHYWYTNIKDYKGVITRYINNNTFTNINVDLEQFKKDIWNCSTNETKLAIYQKDDYQVLINDAIQYHKEALAKIEYKKQQKLLEGYDIELDKWMNDTASINRVNNFYSINSIIYAGLRFNEDKTLVQTSMGVTVPTSHAKRLFGIFKKLEEEGKEFIANGKTIPIGNFRVNSIKKETIPDNTEMYVLRAGCHKIKSSIIHKFIEINNLDW